jgi:hypothetical protein
MSLTSYDPYLSSKAGKSPPKLVSFTDIESILSRLLQSQDGVNRLVQSQHSAFQSASGAEVVSTLPIQTAGQAPQPPLKAGPLAQVCIKTGYVSNSDILVSKVRLGTHA